MCPLGEQGAYVAEFGQKVPHWHSFFWREPDSYFVVEVPPYQIRVYEAPAMSVIYKITHRSDITGLSFGYKTVAQIDATLDLPWDQPERVLEKIQLYLMLS